jgi:drug/metabolite transporter (DMT)-like permease
MNAIATLLWLINVLFDTAGHMCFKAASSHAGGADTIEHWKRLAARPELWAGMGFFVGEFLAWLAFLSHVPLSLAVMVGCFNIIGVMIGGRLFFRERITMARATAILLIVAGVGLVGWGGS